MRLIQLQEKRGELVTQARAALDEITNNTDEARAAELEQRHDKIIGELDKLDKEIAREQRQVQLEKEEEERRAQKRPTGEDGTAPGQDGGEQRTDEKRHAEYRDAFLAYMRAGCDVTAIEAEQRDLLRKAYVETRTQTAGTAAAGGYTVPKELANQIVQVMKDWGPMYDPGVSTEIVTSGGNEFDIPTTDDTGNSAADLAEGADIVDDGSGDMVFGQARLDAYVSATPFVKLSFELMQDSAFDLEGFIAGALGERLGRRANARLTVGTGVAMPNGVVTAASIGVNAASATAIAADELLALFHSVNAAYRRNPKCRFMLPDTTLLAIRKLKDGMGNYLWQLGNIQIGQPDSLLGKPYSINDDVPAIATGNRTVLFGDFSRYWVRKVGAPLIGTVRERFWPKIGMAGLIRFDGELTDANAIKCLKQA
jgi:HK97 family phage major capsid protein